MRSGRYVTGACAVAAAVAVALIVPRPAPARDRLLREYDERNGLWVSEIVELAQDRTGFLWIGTSGGLVRFDGREMLAWAPERVHHVIRTISCARDGRIVVAAAESPLFAVTADGVDTLRGDDGRPVLDWIDTAYDGAGNLWIARPSRLERRDRSGRWTRFPPSAFDSSAFYHVCPLRDGRVLLATERGLFELGERGGTRLASIPFVKVGAALQDGRIAVVTRTGVLDVLGPGDRVETLYRGVEAANAIVARGDVLWATIDRYLLRFAPGAPPDTIAPTPTTPNGRPLLVDQEGSLWLGGFHGLLQFPEPETVIWGERDGLPSPPHGYMIQHDAEGVWATTWYGAVFIPDHGVSRRVRSLGLVSGSFYPDGAGALWWADRERGFMRRLGGREQFFPRPGLHRVIDAARRADGTLWLATDDGPFLTHRDASAPTRVAASAPAEWGDWTDSWLGAIALDHRGTLWLSKDDQVAHANADSLAAGLPVTWTVEALPGSFYAEALAEMPSGHMWCGTGEGGVWRRRDDGHWEPIPGSRALASPRVYGFAASPSGGLWVLADGAVARIRERLDRPEGWEIVETLSAWQGAPSRQAGGLVELPDGRVWLASLAGVIEMPAGCRRAERRPPAVQLVEQRVDGRAMPLDRPLRLPYQRNRLELRFAALSFRDRSLLRYEFRPRAGAPWAPSMDPDFHVVDLAPGRYTVEVRASLDGERWTDPPAMVGFVVLRPWYRESWAIALFALAAAALLLGAHRLRVGMLLRLERQRTRIAMDLHDQMGSGLGSIGILAGLASATHVDEPTRRRLVTEISRTAGELGGTLTDIVSALREGSDRLESFAYRLAERGGRLFPAPPPTFATAFPDQWPDVSLAFALRRELHLIALEALHNAQRHAGAAHVTLGLAQDGDPWRLWVEDDGRGLPPGTGPAGHGLENMRRRAATAGAAISIGPRAGGGTRIEVRFDPRFDPGRAAQA